MFDLRSICLAQFKFPETQIFSVYFVDFLILESGTSSRIRRWSAAWGQLR